MDFAVAGPPVDSWRKARRLQLVPRPVGCRAGTYELCPELRERFTPLRRLFAGACLGLVFYSTTALLLWMFMPRAAAPRGAGAGAGTISHCKFLWIVCGDDARAL